jgi:hypothetical protein
MPPSLSLPPLEFCFGTSPIHAAKSRPDRNARDQQGSFLIRHLVAGDIDEGRLARLRHAYERKVPKLLKWKERGARTGLIFEEDDIFLTNHFVVADALAEIERSAGDRPDEVYLLSVRPSRWLIIRLRVGEQTLYDLPIDERFWEIDPSGGEVGNPKIHWHGADSFRRKAPRHQQTSSRLSQTPTPTPLT